jgi:hypothetical protein
MKKITFLSMILFLLFISCKNDQNSFPDFTYTTVYFPYQSPVRTIELGKDYVVDNSGDNAHNCYIEATMGGVYSNKKNVVITVAVDNTLPTNLKFKDATGDIVLSMPANYYTLDPSNQIVITSGVMSAGIKVHLNDAFFADPLSLKNTYVIPLRMTKVVNADSILSGKSTLTSPSPFIAANWVTVPKNYILFAVKYINPTTGNYLRRGKDATTGSGLDTNLIYHQQYVEYDQVISMSSLSLTQSKLSLTTRNKGSLNNIPYDLQLTTDNAGKITVANVANTTPTYTVLGTGEYVTDGDMWGGIKRDVIRLSYQVNFTGTTPTTHNFKDTIVLRDRGMKFETFVPFKYQ